MPTPAGISHFETANSFFNGFLGYWDEGRKMGTKFCRSFTLLLPLEQDLHEVRTPQLHLGWPIILRTPGSLAVTVHFNWLVGFLMDCEVEKDLGPCYAHDADLF
jgi:hypothetical protein